MSPFRTGLLIASLAAGLGGCAYSQVHLDRTFGQATRESVVAQIADPDAQYSGVPAPGSSGDRVALAQERYQTGTVKEPRMTSASDVYAAGAGAGAGAGTR